MKTQDFDLYFNGKIIDFGDGTGLLERPIIPYTPSPNDRYHKVLQGETITRIAADEYKSLAGDRAQFYWKYIADANQIFNPLDLSAYIGHNIIIPDFNLFKLIE